MIECTEEVSPSDVKATVFTANSAPKSSNSAWITSLTVDEEVVDRGVPRKKNLGFPKAGLVAGVLTQPLQTLG